jgi:hypothetical protein
MLKLYAQFTEYVIQCCRIGKRHKADEMKYKENNGIPKKIIINLKRRRSCNGFLVRINEEVLESKVAAPV